MMLSDALFQISAALNDTAAKHAHLTLSPPELETATRAYFARGGKHLRPALCLFAAHALGGESAAKRALPLALATEYFHLFTLVHDDVIDHDDLRRGKDAAHILAAKESGVTPPAAAAEYGVSAAILAGDALLGRAIELLTNNDALSGEARLCLLSRLCGTTLPRLLSGEALDTKLAYQKNLPDEETLHRVYRDKTGVLFAFALYAGIVAATNAAPDKTLEAAIDSAAEDIGEAFQLTDDYLGLVATTEQMGKNALSDIREGKQTFFVCCAYGHATEEEKRFLDATLGNRDADQNAVQRARDLLLTYGKPLYETRTREAKCRAEALLQFLPENGAHTLLKELFERMIRRDS